MTSPRSAAASEAERGKVRVPLSCIVPALHVFGMGAQVSTLLEQAVIEVQVQVVSLDVVHDE